METKTEKKAEVQGTETKKNRNYSLPMEFIMEMIEKPEMNAIFWKIAEAEPELKVGMLIALTRREFNQLKLKV